jgi:serine-type D-Ala-D-Ala carboxypeptidase/endopeptidase
MGGPSRVQVRGAVATVAVLMLGAAIGGCGSTRGPFAARDPVRATASTPTPSSKSVAHALNAVYHNHRYQLLGICMGAIDQRTRVIKCYGRARPGSSHRPSSATLFQIGSISKTFTATLLALRVHEGAVSLDDPIKRYVPPADQSTDLPDSMTLLDLADHYSGLPRSTPVANSGDVQSLDDYLASAGHCETIQDCPVGTPGERYLYSNFAYGVLGQALGLRDGYSESSYSAWEKDNAANVTEPLGLSHTKSAFAWQATARATFEALRARPAFEPNPPFFQPPPYADPAAGLYSSSSDMLKWLSYSMGLSGTPALNAARPLLYDTARLLRRRENPQDRSARIGLAWRLDTSGSGRSRTTCISKNGLSRGFTSSMVFVQHRPRGAFVLLNTADEGASAASIATELLNALPTAQGNPGKRAVCRPSL